MWRRLIRTEADIPVLAAFLVAIPDCFAKAVEVALGQLALSVKRRQSLFQADRAQSMGISVKGRLTLTPGHTAFDALELHFGIASLMK
jgi:hypothetical protein